MKTFSTPLAVLGLLISGITASPMSTLSKRQGGTVSEPTCQNYSSNDPVMTPETVSTLVRVWRESFGSNGGTIGGVDGFSWRYQAICCSGACLAISHRAQGDAGWTDGDFQGAVDSLLGELSGAQESCVGPVAGDPYLVMMLTDWNQSGQGGSGLEAYGDTCSGAPPYMGVP